MVFQLRFSCSCSLHQLYNSGSLDVAIENIWFIVFDEGYKLLKAIENHI